MIGVCKHRLHQLSALVVLIFVALTTSVQAQSCVTCEADGSGVPGCHARPTDYDGICAESAAPEDRDCDGYPDDCDSDPDVPDHGARVTPPSAHESDDDQVIIHDNCPFKHNPRQEDQDGDAVGDACDVCKAVRDNDQKDSDQDGLGDACDPCPGDPDAHQQAGECSVVITKFADLEDRERRARLSAFLRPSLLGHFPSKNQTSDIEVSAGAHAMLTGSIDRWKKRDRHYVVPPTWFWHIGVHVDVTRFTTTPTRFGPVVGVDWRPLGIPGYAHSFLKDFKLGLLAHYFTGSPGDDQDAKWVQRVGASLNLSFLDIVSLAPGFQADLAHQAEFSFCMLALFDFKYLKDLGVGDVRKLLPKP